MNNETIIALATPPGNSAIGVIRISGNKALEITKKYFLPFKDLDEIIPNNTYIGWLSNNNRNIDNVIVVFYKKPKSFTGEDSIEIFAHGGFYNCQKIIKLYLDNEVRLAGPGEFTKRAYLNNKIDLIQAESILELIHSNNDKIHNIAINNIKGKFSKKISDIRKNLLEIKSRLEIMIDFVEEEINISEEKVFLKLEKIIENIKNIIKSSENNLIYKNGYNIVIAGDTNVGKSSLFNKMINENRAIVTNIPGTTRDMLKEYFNLEGIPIHLYDTAGIRKTDDIIEKKGVSKAKKILESSDLIILLYDIKEGKTDTFYEIKNKYKNLLIAANKTDLLRDNINDNKNEIMISVKKNEGINNLLNEIKKQISAYTDFKDEIYTLNLRHINNLNKSLKAFETVFEKKDWTDIEYLIVDLNEGINYIEDIIGIITTDDVLDEIFSNFCIGK